MSLFRYDHFNLIPPFQMEIKDEEWEKKTFVPLIFSIFDQSHAKCKESHITKEIKERANKQQKNMKDK